MVPHALLVSFLALLSCSGVRPHLTCSDLAVSVSAAASPYRLTVAALAEKCGDAIVSVSIDGDAPFLRFMLKAVSTTNSADKGAWLSAPLTEMTSCITDNDTLTQMNLNPKSAMTFVWRGPLNETPARFVAAIGDKDGIRTSLTTVVQSGHPTSNKLVRIKRDADVETITSQATTENANLSLTTTQPDEEVSSKARLKAILFIIVIATSYVGMFTMFSMLLVQ